MKKTRYAAALAGLFLVSSLSMNSAFARNDVPAVPEVPPLNCTPVYNLLPMALTLLSSAGIAFPTVQQIAGSVVKLSGLPVDTVNQCLGAQ